MRQWGQVPLSEKQSEEHAFPTLDMVVLVFEPASSKFPNNQVAVFEWFAAPGTVRLVTVGS